MKQDDFKKAVRTFYENQKRDLPWRWVDDPYKILISEVMLQQTQVPRVLVKYPSFVNRFPSFESLAQAPLSEVLSEWQGMGYNRRGKFLKKAAEKVIDDDLYIFLLRYSEGVKTSFAQNDIGYCINLLQQLPGIGYNTACAVVTYSFNIPTVFIETNIRTVYLYHFFEGKQNVSDKDILALVEKTLDMQNPRDWYYALMDYGTYLKRVKKVKNIQSKHYAKQSKFEGSRRQMRGRILKTLLTYGPISLQTLMSHLPDDERIESVVEDLLAEGIIEHSGTDLRVAS